MSDPLLKKGKIVLQPGQPLQFDSTEEVDTLEHPSVSIAGTVGAAIKAYTTSARNLLEGKYSAQRELAPGHLSQPCDVFVLRCPDGMLIRYDLVPGPLPKDQKTKIRCASIEKKLAEVAPSFSDYVIHFPDDPANYAPPVGGPEIILNKTSGVDGAEQEIARLRFLDHRNNEAA
jgi:hypothetical protein